MHLTSVRYAPSWPPVVITVAVLSAFVKNIGALAMMIPIAFQFARRSNVSPSTFLMPMSFAALLGGLMTQIGTSPNIVVSRIREEMTGQPFSMFDFTPVGMALTAGGLIFLVLFYWLLPQRKRQGGLLHEALDIKNYSLEAKVGQDSAILDKTVSELMKIAAGEVAITSILRGGSVKLVPFPDAVLRNGDILLLEGDHEALDRLIARTKLRLSDERAIAREDKDNAEASVVEAVIGENSSLIGWSARYLLFTTAST